MLGRVARRFERNAASSPATCRVAWALTRAGSSDSGSAHSAPEAARTSS